MQRAEIEVSNANMNFLEAFSSPTRVRIIEMLNERPMNVKELAEGLGVSSAIVTRHIQKLEGAGIVKSGNSAGKRGMQKVCVLSMEQVVLKFKYGVRKENYYNCSIPVGLYSAYSVKPTCGLVSDKKLIGVVDDPRFFADPEHINAAHIWFGSGWIEYRIPNYILGNQRAESLEISFEICSEAPLFNEEWPSDIYFYVNGMELGMWTSPGDFGENKGVFTPGWWDNGTQHGLLKTLLVDGTGSYIDGIRISDIRIADLGITFNKEILFRIASPENARNAGGVSLFGRKFGNYDQDICVKMGYC